MTNRFALPGPNSKYKLADAEPASFWDGVWHGAVVPVTFVISLLSPGVRIYETSNNGRWYDLGFILGASTSLGGGGLTFHVGSRKGESGCRSGECEIGCCSEEPGLD